MKNCHPMESGDYADASKRVFTVDRAEGSDCSLDVHEPAFDDSVVAAAASGATLDVRVSSVADDETSKKDCLVLLDEIGRTVTVDGVRVAHGVGLVVASATLRLDQRQADLSRGSAQLVVKHREIKGRLAAEHFERRVRGSEMKAIVAAQAIASRKIGCTTYQGLRHVEDLPRLPLFVEASSQGRKHRIVAAVMCHSRERGTRFDVSNGVGSDELGLGYGLPHPLRVRFLDEQLDQRRSVQVDDHPRCSFTIADKVFSPLPSRISAFGKAGFLPLPGRTQGRLRKRAINSASVDAVRRRTRGGSRRATSLPREVTITSSPSATRRRYSDKRLLNSRTEITIAGSRCDYIGHGSHGSLILARPLAKFSLFDSPKRKDEAGSFLSGGELRRTIYRRRNLFRPGMAHEVASALALRQWHVQTAGHLRSPATKDDYLAQLLAEYLVMSCHSQVRKVLRDEIPGNPKEGKAADTVRGVTEGDPLPAIIVGNEELGCEALSVACRRMGRDAEGYESYTLGVLRLLEHYGPFRLAYFEALLRAADARASKDIAQ